MNDNPFGKIIYAYTRAHAIADGVQVDISTTAQEAGIRFPVFITRTAFELYVTVPPDVTGQDEAGRLWDVVWMLRFAIRKAQPGQTRLPFALYVRDDNRAPLLIKLIAACGPLDLGHPEPAIKIMMADEDLPPVDTTRPAGLETVQPVLPCWGFRCHPQTPPPEGVTLWTPCLHRCAGLHASRPFRRGGKESVAKSLAKTIKPVRVEIQ